MPQDRYSLPPPGIHLAVDAVVFAYDDEDLFVLLVQPKAGPAAGKYALPGGFVRPGEGLREALERELQEEAGLEVAHSEQLATYGDDVHRDPRAQVVSVAYWALVRPSALHSAAQSDAQHAIWTSVANVPALAYDHQHILDQGALRLRSKLRYQPVGFDLLPEEFAFSELEKLYSTILGRAVDRRNFQRRIQGFKILTETGNARREGSGRPGKLYRFDRAAYDRATEEGFLFDIK